MNSPIIDPNAGYKRARKRHLRELLKIIFWGGLALSWIAVLHYVW